MFHSLCRAKSQGSVHKLQCLKRNDRRGVEPASFRLPAECLTTRTSRLTGKQVKLSFAGFIVSNFVSLFVCVCTCVLVCVVYIGFVLL